MHPNWCLPARAVHHANIRSLVQQNEVIRTATEYATGLKKTSVATAWHERDYQKISASPASASARPTGGSLTAATMRDAGIKTGVETVKLARQARLKELFEAEAAMYEAELNAMGLALAKPRD